MCIKKRLIFFICNYAAIKSQYKFQLTLICGMNTLFKQEHWDFEQEVGTLSRKLRTFTKLQISLGDLQLSSWNLQRVFQNCNN